jgi:hypothetical protein
MSIIDSHTYRVVREDRPTAVAQVYEATHPEQPGRLLVEVLSAGMSSPPALAACERDIAAVSLLSHPCVLEVLDVGALPDGTPVVISEYPEGISLTRWLEEGRSAADADAVEVIVGLAEALTAAHDAGISHGSLRAEQVYLVRDGKRGLGLPKLRGFGQRWLNPNTGALPAAGVSAEDIAEDIRALASIAELLFTPPSLRGTVEGLGFDTAPPVAAVLRNACAGGDDGFASPRAFAAALAAAVQSEEDAPDRSRALVPDTIRALVQWRKAPHLAIGLAAGASLSLVIALFAGLLSELAPSGEARASSHGLAAVNAATAALSSRAAPPEGPPVEVVLPLRPEKIVPAAPEPAEPRTAALRESPKVDGRGSAVPSPKIADAQPPKIADAEPTKIADAQPAKVAGAQPAKIADAQPAKIAAAQPAKIAAAQPAKIAAAQPAKIAAAQPAKAAAPVEPPKFSAPEPANVLGGGPAAPSTADMIAAAATAVMAAPAVAAAPAKTAPAAPLHDVRRPGSSALRGVVWSDREGRLISVDESGLPVVTAPDGAPPNAPEEHPVP